MKSAPAPAQSSGRSGITTTPDFAGRGFLVVALFLFIGIEFASRPLSAPFFKGNDRALSSSSIYNGPSRPRLPGVPRAGTPANPRPARMCLLLPTLSWASEAQDYGLREAVEKTPLFSIALPSILDTTHDSDGVQYLLLVGHNPDDAVFGSPALGTAVGAREHAADIASDLIGTRTNVHFLVQPLYGTTGTTVIWNILASWGYDIGCDYFVPANDDLLWESSGWATRAITMLRNRTDPCPNFGIVSMMDKNFPGSPTFHVVSRLHMHIHHRAYYPVMMRGFGVDPWIFAAYKAVGAAVLDPEILVENKILEYDREKKEVIKKLPASVERYDRDLPHMRLAFKYAEEEAKFLRQWMKDETNVCCDSLECADALPGSESNVPVVLFF